MLHSFKAYLDLMSTAVGSDHVVGRTPSFVALRRQELPDAVDVGVLVESFEHPHRRARDGQVVVAADNGDDISRLFYVGTGPLVVLGSKHARAAPLAGALSEIKADHERRMALVLESFGFSTADYQLSDLIVERVPPVVRLASTDTRAFRRSEHDNMARASMPQCCASLGAEANLIERRSGVGPDRRRWRLWPDRDCR